MCNVTLVNNCISNTYVSSDFIFTALFRMQQLKFENIPEKELYMSQNYISC